MRRQAPEAGNSTAWCGLSALEVGPVRRQLNQDFPGRPVVKTPHFSAGCTVSIPGVETKILHASWLNQKKKKKSTEDHDINLVGCAQ